MYNSSFEREFNADSKLYENNTPEMYSFLLFIEYDDMSPKQVREITKITNKVNIQNVFENVLSSSFSSILPKIKKFLR